MGYDDRPMFGNPPQTLDGAGQPEAWERRKTESKRAFDAFALYRDSPDRKLANVAKALVPPCSVPNVARWSTQHNWQARAWAWDVHQDEQLRTQAARDRSAMYKRHLKVAMLMQEIAVAGLLELRAKLEQKLPLGLSADESKALMDAGTKLERVTVGPEKERGRYTQINVILGDYEDEEGKVDEEKFEAALIEGGDRKVN
jgi:hypothetical protein